MHLKFKNGLRVGSRFGHNPLRLLKAITCLFLSFLVGWLALADADAATRHARARRRGEAQARPGGKHAREFRRAESREKSAEARALEPEAEGEDPEGRASWFYFKRAYPFGQIPPDARRRAWEARPGRVKGLLELSAQQQQTWTPIGPAPTTPKFFDNWGQTSGRINAVAVSPSNPQLILVGASTGGVWRSTDGGQTFAPASDDQVDLAVGAIAFAPSDSSTVYAGMGDNDNGYVGTGVLKSTDGGQTWARVSNSTLPAQAVTGDIAVDPTNPNRVYVAQPAKLDAATNIASPGGFFLSSDGGVNWTKTLGGNARDVAIHTTNPQTLYLGMRTVDGGTPGVYKSTNGGQTWSLVFVSPYGNLTRDLRLAVTPADPERVYAYIGRSTGGVEVRVEVSADGGATWSNRGAAAGVDPAQFGYNTYVNVSPSDASTVYVGARDIYKSTDGGLTWANLTNDYTPVSGTLTYTPRSSKAHSDQQSFAFSPADPNLIYAANDGGLYKSADGGQTFRSLNSTLSLTQFVHLSLHPTDPSISYGGTQDNGTQKRLAGSSQWAEFSTGDGGHSVIDPIDPSLVYPTYVRGTVFRYFQNGTLGAGFGAVADESAFGESFTSPRIAFYPPFTGNGADHKLYFGTWRLFVCADCNDPTRSIDGTKPPTWAAPAGTLDLTKGNSDVLNVIVVAPSNTNVIYTGSVFGRAMVSTDGGSTWTDVTAGLPDRAIESITVDQLNPAVAYLTVSGYASGHVFKTTNAGAAWTDVSGNLPNVPVNCFLFDPLRPTTVYVGTDVGVFRSSAGGTTWETFNSGMPPVIVTALASQANGKIQAATYGRGAYEFAQAAPPPAQVSFAAANANASESDGRVSLTVTRTDSAGAASVDYATADGTASERSDYTTARGTLLFAPGETTKTLDVLITDDAFAEPPEAFTVALGTAANLTVVSPSAVAVTVNDNDAASGLSRVRWDSNFDSRFFVRQHYLDFLGREPDAAGLQFWTNEIEQCGADAQCREAKRVNVSAAFFLSIEFQETGYLVYKTYKASFGDISAAKPVPLTFRQLMGDSRRVARNVVVGQADWQARLEANKQAFFNSWVQRPEFLARYPTTMTPAAFVDALNANTGGALSAGDHTALINQLTVNNTSSGRALVLHQVAENSAFSNNEKNRAFVLMQYFGYLRRDPDDAPNTDFSGWQFWLDKLNSFNGDFVRAEMVKAFIISAEYQQRFGL
jgi:photosystem II stability/assembly factor-like uncharacterized protein